ncbi:MAG: CBS domain-containing protein [Candidatus Nitronauta litoralis]|uniref:CBS domain-containing protein n=1 Tax=Candidatus Nitronauta litoralis TaxID=2705533 RepID=A0A7T0BZP9_9BACT|nr:MAG: CBS domain-containing protein [Candidatus Nitronauta litoralis]
MEEIGEFMTSPVLRIEAEDSAQDAAAFMEGNHVGSLIVQDVGDDIGIITERDLSTKVVAAGKDPLDVKIRDIMTTPVLTMDRYLPVEEANRYMLENKIRHLAITEEDRIVGILSVKDLIKFYSKQFRMQE